VTPEQLADRMAVVDVLYAFAEGIDRRDWALYRSVFTDEIDLDYSSYRPGNVGRWRADDWVARAVRVFPGLDASQHTISNPRVAVTGDSARLRAAVRADHVLFDEGRTLVYTVCGSYDDALVRTAAGWQICGKTLHMRWSEGDATIMELAVERAEAARRAR
jgi:3-phenylpropionate/cinnamic acid dioxygenase small subunit